MARLYYIYTHIYTHVCIHVYSDLNTDACVCIYKTHVYMYTHNVCVMYMCGIHVYIHACVYSHSNIDAFLKIVVHVYLSLFSPHDSPPPQPSPLPTLDPTHLWFCPCVLYTCSWKPFPFSPPFSPPTSPLAIVSRGQLLHQNEDSRWRLNYWPSPEHH